MLTLLIVIGSGWLIGEAVWQWMLWRCRREGDWDL